MPDTDPAAPDLTTLTVQLLSAYLANNKLEHGELPGLIQSTRTALAAPPTAPDPKPAAEPDYARAVSVRKSLADPDRIISMIDGKPYRTLTRHLAKHGITPAEYRARYKLPADYPTIAPGYSEERRRVARDRGLGRKKADDPASVDGETTAQAEPDAPYASPSGEAEVAPARRVAGRRQGAAAGTGARRTKAAASTSPEPEAEAASAAAPKTRKRRAAKAGPADDATAAAPPARRRGRRGGGSS